MIQFYKEYYYWEDYINGMYDIPKKENEFHLINLAIDMLSNNTLFFNTCIDVINNWHISTKVNLTNKLCNRRAWIGQASCSYKYKVPEICTRIAWNKLTEIQQYEANKIADKIINSFEINYEKQDNKIY